jgi:hypothetical protein
LLAEVFDDPVPDEVIAGCEELFTWRTIEAELAELEDDDVVDGALAGVRSASPVATLRFVGEGLRVEIDYDPERRVVSGQIFPAGPASVSLVRPRMPSTLVAVSASGTFEIADSLPGPVQIVVEASGRTARTDWIVLQPHAGEHHAAD